MLKKLIKIFGVYLVLVGANGCTTTVDCDLEQESDLLRIKFFDKETLLETKYRFSTITAAGTDSVFYQGDSISVFDLNLNPLAKTVNYTFFDGFIREKLEIVYDSKAIIISERCGATIQYELDSITSTDFDSVVLISQIIDPLISHNIEIYR